MDGALALRAEGADGDGSEGKESKGDNEEEAEQDADGRGREEEEEEQHDDDDDEGEDNRESVDEDRQRCSMQAPTALTERAAVEVGGDAELVPATAAVVERRAGGGGGGGGAGTMAGGREAAGGFPDTDTRAAAAGAGAGAGAGRDARDHSRMLFVPTADTAADDTAGKGSSGHGRSEPAEGVGVARQGRGGGAVREEGGEVAGKGDTLTSADTWECTVRASVTAVCVGVGNEEHEDEEEEYASEWAAELEGEGKVAIEHTDADMSKTTAHGSVS